MATCSRHNGIIIILFLMFGLSMPADPSFPHYYGCYKAIHGFRADLHENGLIGVVQCIDTCIQNSFKYAVLRGFGTSSVGYSTCYCRNKLAKFRAADESKCTKICPTNTDLRCGNTVHDYNSIYQNECQTGYWGLKEGSVCYILCHCNNDQPCNINDGACPDGLCEPGWQASSTAYYSKTCDQPCANRSFGAGCAEECHCLDGASCDHVTGVCSNDQCEPGYTGHSCSQACAPGSFGADCGEECHCLGGASCDHVTGLCSNGACEPGYIGDSCSQEEEGTKQGQAAAPQTAIIAGGAAAAVVVVAIAIVLFLVFFLRRRKDKNVVDNDGIQNAEQKEKSTD